MKELYAVSDHISRTKRAFVQRLSVNTARMMRPDSLDKQYLIVGEPKPVCSRAPPLTHSAFVMNDYRSNGSHHDSPLKLRSSNSASSRGSSSKKKAGVNQSNFLNSTFQMPSHFYESPVLTRRRSQDTMSRRINSKKIKKTNNNDINETEKSYSSKKTEKMEEKSLDQKWAYKEISSQLQEMDI